MRGPKRTKESVTVDQTRTLTVNSGIFELLKYLRSLFDLMALRGH